MTLQYVKQKDELPQDTDLECCICILPIDLDEIVGGVPNCVICINGHRMHNICYNNYIRYNNYGKNICPTCNTNIIKFCKTNSHGYSYAPRTGGKKRKTCKKRKTKK